MDATHLLISHFPVAPQLWEVFYRAAKKNADLRSRLLEGVALAGFHAGGGWEELRWGDFLRILENAGQTWTPEHLAEMGKEAWQRDLLPDLKLTPPSRHQPLPDQLEQLGELMERWFPLRKSITVGEHETAAAQLILQFDFGFPIPTALPDFVCGITRAALAHNKGLTVNQIFRERELSLIPVPRKHRFYRLRNRLKKTFLGASARIIPPSVQTIVNPNYRSLSAAFVDICWTVDNQGLLLDWRDGGRQLLTFSQGISFHRFIHPESIAEWEKIVDRCLNGEIRVSGRLTLKTRVGRRFFEVRGHLSKSESLSCIRFAGRDVTLESEIHEQTITRNNRLDKLFAAGQDGVYDWNLQANILWRNDTFKEAFGPEMPDDNWLEKLVHPAEQEMVREHLERNLREKNQHWKLQFRLRRRAGDYLYVENNATIEYSRSGLPTRIIGIIRDVTPVKIAEQTLRENLNFLKTMIATIPNPVFYKGPRGRYRGCNRAFETFIGRREDDIRGKEMSDLFPDYPTEIHRKVESELMNGGAPVSYIAEIPGPENLMRTVVFHMAGIESEQGNVLGVVGTFIDITRQREIQQALKESEARYRTLVETSPEAICVYQDSQIVFANAACLRLLGAADLRHANTRRLIEFIPAPDRQRESDRLERIEAGAYLPPLEHRLIRMDNQTIEVESSIRSIVFQGKKGLQAVMRDITERKAAQQALLDSQQRYSALVHSIEGIVWEMDNPENFELSFVSDQWERVLGDGPEIWDKNPDLWRQRLHPEERDGVLQEFVQHFRNETQGEITYRMIRADGQIVWLRDLISVVTDAKGFKKLVGVKIDITTQKIMEEEQQRLQDRIRQSQKLESLGVLAGGIAHDFNNILTGILGHTGMAQLNTENVSPAWGSLQSIEKAANRAADLCQQMLAYSGRGQFVIKPLCINDIIRDMDGLFQSTLPKKVTLGYNFDPDLPLIDADAAQMTQLVLNLMTNAAEAIGEKTGRVDISTRLTFCDCQAIKNTIIDHQLPPGEYVCLTVADEGCGMSKETLARIFDPFFTTKFTGRGLGLAAVLGIVRSHGGTMTIETEENRGTVFQLYFPPSTQPAPAPATAPAEGKGIMSNHANTILVVDDEETIRQLCGSILEREGFTVLQAEDGIEAMTLLKEGGQEVSLVLVDMTMPRMDGPETLSAIRNWNPTVKVLLTSGYSEEEAINNCRENLPDGFIKKPFYPRDLVKGIKEALEG